MDEELDIPVTMRAVLEFVGYLCVQDALLKTRLRALERVLSTHFRNLQEAVVERERQTLDDPEFQAALETLRHPERPDALELLRSFEGTIQ